MSSSLENCRALHMLSSGERGQVAELGREVTFRAGDAIVEDGSESRSFFIVLRGRVEIRKRQQRLAELAEGDMLGEMALFNHHTRDADARAVDDATLLEIRMTDFWPLVLHQEAFAIKLLESMGQIMVERLHERDRKLAEGLRLSDQNTSRDLGAFAAVKKQLLTDWSLKYHALGRPGKLAVVATKSTATAADLSIAYSPGVAEPCLLIRDQPDRVYEFTAKGQLVGVLTNGTAVLGLGDIGPRAAKPVMEGKAVLFKRFADVDAFDIEIDEPDPDRLIDVICALAPTFGGINLEDIRAPECFRIEAECQRRLDIPVFHDDQHGTAIIAGAGLLNALEVAGKAIEDVRVVFAGAGAAGFACARYFLDLGVRRANLIMTDRDGVVYAGRGDNNYLEELAVRTTARTLSEAIVDADVFVGVSVGNILKPTMLEKMARDPIVFALANPIPEIEYSVAYGLRNDVIVATGRSDTPNQINNVIAFPYIFRGALDVRATAIDLGMKRAATAAIAALARVAVGESAGFDGTGLVFGRDYLVPKPFDQRLLLEVAPAVAQAAAESGVARTPVDPEAYRNRLLTQLRRRS